MYIRYFDLREVTHPERAHSTDAGIDFFCPEIDTKFMTDFGAIPANSGIHNYGTDWILIPPGANAVIPSGIKVEIPYGYMGLFLNKSGVATKSKLLIGAQVIDAFYSGEVHIDLHNVGIDDIKIIPGQKLAQMVVVPVVPCQPILAGEDDLYLDFRMESYRNEKGFGSSDQKVSDKK
jgi:dUTP pyrophosphatase